MSAKREGDRVFTKRAVLLAGGGLVGLGAVAVRMAQLQTTDFISGQWTEAARENRYDRRVVAPPRGIIYDRFGVQLATTRRDLRVSIIPEDVDDLEKTIADVAALLGHDADWVRRRTREARAANAYEPFVLRQGLHWDDFCRVNVRLPELKGVTADDTETRSYPFGPVFAHPIGYVQKPTQREIDRVRSLGPEGERRAVYLRTPDVRLGKAGLEKNLEDTLHGEAGWRLIEVNASGRPVNEHPGGERKPHPGSGVVLTIDSDLQRTAMEAFGDQAGAVVVMDILNGDILVMASAPSFDSNLFINGIGPTDFRALNEDEKKPLFNKAVAGAYPPGSTFKTMVGIAAKQGGVEDDWRISCPGYFPYGGRNFHCWKRGGHGSIDMHGAMRSSCDVYFYNAALRAGPERIAAVAREFGFGVSHDITLPHVASGLVPDPTWWREHRHEGWTGGLTLNYGIGQGSLLVTPLQLCVMAARIGNNGKAVVPRLVREAPGFADRPDSATMHGIAPEHLGAIRAGMYGVCNEGGGTALRAGNMLQLARRPDGVIVDAAEAQPGWAPIRIAGKTGTSQARIITAAERLRGVRRDADLPWRLRDNALFVCFGPWDAPRYACAVVIEHGGHINPAFDASPIAATVLRKTFLKDPANRAPARLAALDAAAHETPA